MNKLIQYIDANGILLCNANPYLPSLDDIGCSWNDVTEAIDQHELFYSKAFKKRTTYLSKEVYYLLKAIKNPKPITPSAERIYSLLNNNPDAETTFLKEASGLDSKAYKEGFDFLLQNLYITALQNGTTLNANWSTFCYGTSLEWEKHSPNIYNCDNARERLWEILSGTMTEKLFLALIK